MSPRLRLLLMLVILVISTKSFSKDKVGEICHVETDYYSPGIWERYSETELICNYWKFLGDEDREIFESQLNENEESESENDYGDYDSYDEMNQNPQM